MALPDALVPDSLSAYYDRWRALDQLIARSCQTYERQPAFPRQLTVLHLLKSLREFATGHFQFFYYGLDRRDPNRSSNDPVLTAAPGYPAEDILTGVLEQIAHDLELIRKAADQRILGDENIRQTLATADKLAWIAVKPAVDYAAVEEATTVLTYFQKSAEFYRIPYAQVALISIPFTCTSEACLADFLAIPHEAGHYVCRHAVGEAQVELSKLRKALDTNTDIPKEYRTWIKTIFEETFADIYGCLIAGPVMALDFEKLSLANSQADFADGDGEHPNPALRPFVYCEVLQNAEVGKRMHHQWPRLGLELAQDWELRLKQMKITHFGIKSNREEDSGKRQITEVQHHMITAAVTVAAAPALSHGPVGDIVLMITSSILDTLLDYGQKHRPSRYQGNTPGWAGPLTPQTESQGLLDQYAHNFASLLASSKLLPPEADPSSVTRSSADTDTHSSQLWIEWVLRDNPELGQWPPKKAIESGSVKTPGDADRGHWGYILYAQGWTTTGPDGDPGHPFLGRR